MFHRYRGRCRRTMRCMHRCCSYLMISVGSVKSKVQGLSGADSSWPVERGDYILWETYCWPDAESVPR